MLRRLQAMKAKKGFTLVELIVVIAIIAVLAAILIPMLMNQVRNSRCTREMGNLKSAANALAERISDRFTEGLNFNNAVGSALGVDLNWNYAAATAYGTGSSVAGQGAMDGMTVVITNTADGIEVTVGRTTGPGHSYASNGGERSFGWAGAGTGGPPPTGNGECDNATCPVRRVRG